MIIAMTLKKREKVTVDNKTNQNTSHMFWLTSQTEKNRYQSAKLTLTFLKNVDVTVSSYLRKCIQLESQSTEKEE